MSTETKRVPRSMIRRLTIPQVEKRKALIIGLLAVAYGDDFSETIAATTITDMLAGRVQCWEIITKDSDGVPHFVGMFTTSIAQTRRYGGRRSLYLEAMASNRKIPPEIWAKGLRALSQFAQEQGCAIIEADVRNERLAQHAENLGFQVACVRIVKEV